MELIRLIQFGHEKNSLIHSLRDKLNAIQDHFYFIFNDDIIDKQKNTDTDLVEYPTSLLEKDLLLYLANHNFTEYSISITSIKMTDDYFYSSTQNLAYISIADWEDYTNVSVLKGLEFMVTAVLIDRKINNDLHEKPRGCSNDFCDNKKEIDLELKNCDYCTSCKKTIFKSVERGFLSMNEVTAVFRILDDVADRMYSFVLMPFKTDFSSIYKTIKRTLTSKGYICMRADEISRSTSVIQIIIEQIGRSSLIIADLTDLNPNVFYELGYAHALV